MRALGLLMLLAPMVALAQPVDVIDFVGLANTNGRVELKWTNAPATDGVLIIRRATTPPGYTPGTGPSKPSDVGAVVGNQPETGTWVIADMFSLNVSPNSVTTFVDQGAIGGPLVAGTRYYYRIFNTERVSTPGQTPYRFSSGLTPTAQGISVWAINPAATMLKWCYSVGLPNLMRPVITPNGVRSIGQLGRFNANNPSNGAELFRPVPLQVGQTSNSVQARPISSDQFDGQGGPVVTFTGDHAGYAYRFDGTTGVKVWERTSNQLFGTASAPVSTAMPIQASPSAQTNALATNVDLVFFGSRSGSTDNAVAALRTNGSRQWLYRPSGMGDVLGEMMVDSKNNRLWIPTNSASKPIHIVSSINGTPVTGPVNLPASPQMLPVHRGIVMGDAYRDANGTPVDRVVLVPAQNGIWGFRRDTMEYLWHIPLPSAPNSHVSPIQKGFFVPFGNTVRRYRWNATDEKTTPHQHYGDVSVSGAASTVRFALGHAVFSAGNSLYAIDASMNIVSQFAVPLGGVIGHIQEDAAGTAGYFGTADGRICKVEP